MAIITVDSGDVVVKGPKGELKQFITPAVEVKSKTDKSGILGQVKSSHCSRMSDARASLLYGNRWPTRL